MLVISGVSVKWALKFQVTEFHYSYCDAQTADDFSRPSTNSGTCKHKYLLQLYMRNWLQTKETCQQIHKDNQTNKQIKNNPETNKQIKNKKNTETNKQKQIQNKHKKHAST